MTKLYKQLLLKKGFNIPFEIKVYIEYYNTNKFERISFISENTELK